MLVGCLGLSGRAQNVREGLLALDVKQLRSCLGNAPFYEIREDGSELWGYSGALPPAQEDIQISRSTGPGTAFQRPRVEAGNPIERGAPESASVTSRRIERGQCLHLFTVKDGKILAYDSRGRSFTNMNADAECTLQLSQCLPEPASGPSASD